MGVDVHDGDLVLHCYGGGALGVGLGGGVGGGGGDEGAGALGREDVFDADGDGGETLLYCEMMDYFGAVEAVGRLAEVVPKRAWTCVSSLASLGSIDDSN